jgi:hypothetical protein
MWSTFRALCGVVADSISIAYVPRFMCGIQFRTYSRSALDAVRKARQVGKKQNLDAFALARAEINCTVLYFAIKSLCLFFKDLS